MSLSPRASLSERSATDCGGPVHAEARLTVAVGPLTQGGLICLCKEGH